jgi:5'-nucleotidase
MHATNTTVCVFNSGAIRLDDQLMGTITEYDILRCLPFSTDLVKIHVTGSRLVKVLNRGLMNINTGMFISYAGLEHDAAREKWFVQSNRQLLDDEKLQLTIVSIPYFYFNSDLKQSSEMVKTNISMTRAFIDYLERTYSKAIHQKSS